jgi:preprotein translocase subunit SecF
VIPVASLMVVAVWLLGVGTLKDLALVQLVGILVGTYSSIFLATPLLVTLRERTDVVRNHTRRVVNRRKPAGGRREPVEATDGADGPAEPVAALAGKTGKPAPGTRPTRPSATRTGRPSGKRNTRRR